MIVIDTSAWVEYFIGSRKGIQIESLLKPGEIIATPVIVLIELSCKSIKEEVDFSSQLDFIKSNSIVLNIDEALVLPIAKNYIELRRKNKKLSLADAIIITIAKNQGAVLVTCDSDFVGADKVKIIS